MANEVTKQSKADVAIARLLEVQRDMRRTYDMLCSGEIELKEAAERANVAGKNLKSEQLVLAWTLYATASSNRLERTEEQAAALAQAQLVAADA